MAHYSFYDFLSLIGALGLFLYGMRLMSEGLQKIAGDKMRHVLTAMTRNRCTGILSGLGITMLIQSSSATTVMVVSFVNAGLLNLAQAISVIMGANVGTTVTAWMLSIFGFRFSIAALALPIIAISIPFVFSSVSKRKSFGEFLLGFALLFMGLELLQTSIPDIPGSPEFMAYLARYTDYGYFSILIFLLVGTLLTMVVQSSSATMAITMVLFGKGWIPFELGAAMVLGENIGTTITANIAAIATNTAAKRAALAHSVFNIFGVLWVLMLFYPFTHLVAVIVQQVGPADPRMFPAFLNSIDVRTLSLLTDESAVLTPAQMALKAQYAHFQLSSYYALALFHTLFNLFNTCLLVGFVGVLERVVTKLIRSKDNEQDVHLTYLASGLLSTSELSILQAGKEVDHFAGRCLEMFRLVRTMYQEKDEHRFQDLVLEIDESEHICDRIEVEIADYLTKVAEGRLSDESKQNVRAMLRMISEIDSIADSCYNLSRILQNKRMDSIEYPPSLDVQVSRMFDLLQQALDEMMRVLKRTDLDRRQISIKVSNDIEQEINALRLKYKMQNAVNVKQQLYSYPVGISYMDLISECEKLGDYVMNVVEQYSEAHQGQA